MQRSNHENSATSVRKAVAEFSPRWRISVGRFVGRVRLPLSQSANPSGATLYITICYVIFGLGFVEKDVTRL